MPVFKETQRQLFVEITKLPEIVASLKDVGTWRRPDAGMQAAVGWADWPAAEEGVQKHRWKRSKVGAS